ncbi:Uma2 family endonuclease [Kitasatospora paracochleata]|uniref:Uma2 family endonuclease n=1 Tax=Kitasatospora paracochleata TaxID=58354 RepID=A0ABT1IXG6_9ACTN|nr:Uma2 family endonuclease [Kitasatospora paracochleata]MCP2309846.1 Uma2 family endonuclease [Kitasatospora paracochleata]
MVAMPAVQQPLPAENGLLQTFLELETPPGYRAELIDGEIVVTPPPDGSHETAFSLINKQFVRRSAIDLDVSGNKGLVVPGGHFIPDGTISPVGHFEDAEPWAGPGGVLLVFEITSTNPVRDREAKRRGYAAAGIPCYLLVDRGHGTVTLFTDPSDGDYQAHSEVTFGKPLELPAPFSFTLDTAPLR